MKFVNNKTRFPVLIKFFIFAIVIGFYIVYSNTKQSNIDLNGLWKNNENTAVAKITQTGNTIIFTMHQLDPNWRWPGKVGDVTVEATLKNRKLTGKIMIVPERGYCIGYNWWHDYAATVSKDGKTINEVFQTNIYDRNTCQETSEYPQKSKTLMKIE